MYKKIGKACFLLGNKGVSLLEIVIAVSLLAVITVTFFPLYNVSQISIFSEGVKSQTLSSLSSKMELLNTLNSVSLDATITALYGAANVTITVNPALLYIAPANGSFRFYRTASTPVAGCSGYNVVLVMFYENGAKYITMTSFFKDKVAGGV